MSRLQLAVLCNHCNCNCDLQPASSLSVCVVPLTPPKQPIALLKQCSASSYGTFGIGLRATKSLTASMGRQSRQLTGCQADRALYVELHCLEGALEEEESKFRGEDF
jgi:hypothetical protein